MKISRISQTMMLSLTDVVFLRLLLLVSFPNIADSSKILFFNGMGEGSHFSAASALGEELVSRGHRVTFIISSEFQHLAKSAKFTRLFEFILIDTEIRMAPYYERMTMAKFEGLNPWNNLTFGAEIGEAEEKQCSMVFSPVFQKNLKRRRFDIFIFDPWWPCCISLGIALKITKVVLNPASLNPLFLRAFGLHVNSALLREHGTGLPEKMSFFQRLQNVLLSYNIPVLDNKPFHDALTNVPLFTNFGISGDSSYWHCLSDANLFISCSDQLLYPDMAETAGHISAAGLTARDAVNLNQDIENFIQSSGEYGIILYSLGSYLTHLPENFVMIFREVFAQVPQHVIWQWKEEVVPSNTTNNVKLMKWIPQNDLLGHNKTKLLISHGGNNGLHEAIYHAVPLLVIPLGGDQYDVAQKIVEKEIGLRIPITDVTIDIFHKAIKTLLTDPRYQKNINKMSTMFRDRPLSSRQKAAYWIEHVLKYGSDHFHSASRELNHFQQHLIDVYAFILSILSLITIGIVFLLPRLVNKLLRWAGKYKKE